MLLLVLPGLLPADNLEQQRAAFTEAWSAASRGERAQLEQALGQLQDYVLYPYLQYEDYRHRRRAVDAAEMSAFLDQHADWAFAPGLETAWLRTLGQQAQWDALIAHAGTPKDTEVRCYLAQAHVQSGQTTSLLPEARALWTAGQSQPDPCDPVFDWLRQQDGIGSGLAWERIRLVMVERERRMVPYLARYLDQDKRVWADRWYQQDRGGYRQLGRARTWPDTRESRDITAFGLRRLARSDPERAWAIFETLDGRFAWSDAERGGIVRELALWSAVDRSAATGDRMRAVPDDYRDDQLLEWWARFGLYHGDWPGVVAAIGLMSEDARNDSRWRFWRARARLENGDADRAREQLEALAEEASYYGFLAADLVDLPYTICPQDPDVDNGAVQILYDDPGFTRALELRRAGVPNWARGEWKLAARQLDNEGLRAAAAVATRENWPDMAIFALGNSGDLRWYEWRFPVNYEPLVQGYAGSRNLDPSWVLGLMRSESAMAEDAVSSAGARGLMQVTPGTARQLARRHAFPYSGSQQLLQAEDSVRFGTAYLRDLMDRFGENTVLASGAYNAGPHVVERWLNEGDQADPAVWIDTLPYFETRDYIPRVLAFSTLYDWRTDQPVKRISSRMPPVDGNGPGAAAAIRTADVVCRVSG